MKNILKNKNALLGILVVGIISMTIAFAALTTQLNIVGTAKVSQQNFKVVIDDWARDNNQPSLITNTTNTAYEITPASVTSNTMTISGLKVGFKQPGDAIKYTFNIENQGTIDATLASFSIGTPTCTNASTSEVVTCPSMTYEIKCGNPLATPQVGDNLLAGQTIPCTYYLAYNEVTQEGNITKPALEVSNINASWNYVQTTSNNTPMVPNYTVSYNANGGQGTMSDTTNSISVNEFTRDGYEFAGWNTSSDGTGTSYTSSSEVTSNLLLYATWGLPWQPTYFKFGTPTTSDTTVPDKTVFIGMDSSNNYGVCINNNNNVTCFKSNDVSFEQQHLRNVFGESSCAYYDDDGVLDCVTQDFGCSVRDSGNVYCSGYNDSTYCNARTKSCN